jgi:hypothetical protein
MAARARPISDSLRFSTFKPHNFAASAVTRSLSWPLTVTLPLALMITFGACPARIDRCVIAKLPLYLKIGSIF